MYDPLVSIYNNQDLIFVDFFRVLILDIKRKRKTENFATFVNKTLNSVCWICFGVIMVNIR